VTAYDQTTGVTLSPAALVSSIINVTPPQATLQLVGTPSILDAATLLPAGTSLALGKPYLLTATIANTGFEDATNLTNTAMTFVNAGVTGTVGAFSPSPDRPALLKNASYGLTWLFTPGVATTGASKLTVAANVIGTTVGTTYTATLATPLAVGGLDVIGATLTASAIRMAYTPVNLALPQVIPVNNLLDFEFTVTNTGLATAYNVAPSWNAALFSSNWILTTPAPLNKATGLPVGSGVTLTAGASATFSWRFQANVPNALTSYSVSAVGRDPFNMDITTGLTNSAGIQIQPGAAQPIILSSSLLRTDGGAVAGPYGMGQVFTLRFTVSNTAASSSNAFVGLTPTVTGTGAWSAVTVLTPPALVSVNGVGAQASPMWISPGASVTYDVVLRVTQTAAATSSDIITVSLGGIFTDQAVGPGLPISPVTTFPMSIQPAFTTNVAVTNEVFLNYNTFYPPADTLIVNFTVKTSGNVKVGVYNVAGEKVKALFDGYAAASANPAQAILYSGTTDARLRWDGTADDGHPVSSGTYLIYFEGSGYNEIKKVNLLR
jgi:hypothetical protein